MHLRSMVGGLLAAGLLSVGCGGTEPLEQPEQSLTQTEQELAPSCPAGYTLDAYWDCAQVCGSNWGNFLRYYCTNGYDYYEVGTGSVRCGACY
jgi:epoxyqueuosine reductase QueG